MPEILIVDDEPANLVAIHAALEPLGEEIVAANSGAEALRRLLENDFAVILLDVKLPDMDGFEVAALVRQRPRSRHTPIIFITGFRQEEYLQKGYRAGGVDILFKPIIPEVLRSKVAVFLELRRSARELEALNTSLEKRVEERTAELSRTVDALREASERLRLHFENSPLGIVEWDRDCRVLQWNQEAARIFGWAAEEMIGTPLVRLVHEEDRAGVQHLMADMVGGSRLSNISLSRGYRKDGSIIDCEWYNSALLDAGGKLKTALSFVVNVTERKRMDDQIRAAQRLESLGVLAGGVAHDFNNLLTGIVGNSSLVLDDLDESDRNRPLVESVLKAGQSAAHLTAQLLAYAGKGRFTVSAVDLSEVVWGLADLVRHSISSGVRLELELADDLPPVETDPEQMSQLAMNLIVNGAEAIPRGEAGTVRVRTSVREVAGDVSDLPGGRYVSLEVSDTGCGIDHSAINRIFEPFYTTKFLGRGLGLAAVHGIVRNTRGSIQVKSEVGQGSTFTVLLPAMEAADKQKVRTADAG